jgi:hypothetical protein
MQQIKHGCHPKGWRGALVGFGGLNLGFEPELLAWQDVEFMLHGSP